MSTRTRAVVAGSIATLLALAAWFFLWPAVGQPGADVPASKARAADSDAARDREPDTDVNTSATKHILVEVVDKKSQAPITGAAVVVIDLGGRSGATVTADTSGVAEVDIAAGAQLNVSGFGYTARRFVPPPVLPDGAAWTVALERSARDDGKEARFGVVLDAEGRGVEGAFVAHHNTKFMKTGLVSAEGGRFVLPDGTSAGDTFLALSAEHGEGEAVLAADAPLRITLAAPGYIEGTIVREDGEALSDVSISVWSRTLAGRRDELWRMAGPGRGGDGVGKFLQNRLRQFNNYKTFKDVELSEDGAFRIGPVALGKVNVTAEAEGVVPETLEDLRVPGGSALTGLRFTLGAPAKITGVVVDKTTAQPIGGAEVRIAQRPRPGQKFGRTQTASDGTFTLAVAGTGPHSIDVKKRKYAAFSQGGIVADTTAPPYVEVALRRLKKGESGKDTADYVGIGTVVKRVEGGILVQDLIAGGAASDVLQKGDVIRRADGEWLDQSSLKDAVQLLLGEEDTEIDLLIQRPGLPPGEDEIEVTLQRRRIQR